MTTKQIKELIKEIPTPKPNLRLLELDLDISINRIVDDIITYGLNKESVISFEVNEILNLHWSHLEGKDSYDIAFDYLYQKLESEVKDVIFDKYDESKNIPTFIESNDR